MYPTQFGTINEMTKYLYTLKELGFNAVWLNPLQACGDINDFFKSDKNNGVTRYNEVTRSIYAMSDPDTINPLFNVRTSADSAEKVQQLNKKALQLFTQTARTLDIVPMFDLVLNHMAIDARLCQDKPHWFKGIHEDFKDVRGFNYDDETIRKEIIREFWHPYIRKYMLDYGFDGVRVDAVGYVHSEVRGALYEYINALALEHGKPTPVIIDEALFAKRPLEAEAEYLKLPTVGPTHITTEMYSAQCNPDGSLPKELLKEEQLKAQVVFNRKDGSLREHVKGGCINFSGNHDYRSLAMTVLLQMAKQRFLQDPLHHEFIDAFLQNIEVTDGQLEHNFPLKGSLKTTILYSYANDLIQELDTNKSTQEEFERLLNEKMALCALTGSGGWFILSGDETSDIYAKTVFQRKGAVDKSYYPQREHRVFTTDPDSANKVLEIMANESFIEEHCEDKTLLKLYHDLNKFPELQKRFICSHLDNVKNQINAGIPHILERFQKLLSEYGIKTNSESDDFIPKLRTPQNGWLGLHNNFAFIKQINSILTKLPVTQVGFTSECIRLSDKPELVVVIRKNGESVDAPLDIVIVNVKPEQVTVTRNDLEQIAKLYCDLCGFSKSDDEQKNSWQRVYKRILECSAQNRVHVDNTIQLEWSKSFTFGSADIKTFYKKQSDTNSTPEKTFSNYLVFQ